MKRSSFSEVEVTCKYGHQTVLITPSVSWKSGGISFNATTLEMDEVFLSLY